MPRGGRRPGAGAPAGNLNAFKTGARSPRARRAVERLIADPAARRALAELVEVPATAARRRKRRRTVGVEPALPHALAATIGELMDAVENAEARERERRLLARLRRLRAMLTARIERDERRANSWHALLAGERARAVPRRARPLRPPATKRPAHNQSPARRPASEQSKNRRKKELIVEAAIAASARVLDFAEPARWPPSILDDPLLWEEPCR
jgi:hypothetical protein